MMRALSIRQPYAELILRGIKRIEYRSRPTKIIGQRFFIYAAKSGGWKDELRRMKNEPAARRTWSRDLADDAPPPWMLEMANALRLFPHELPTGVIVGSAVIERVSLHAPHHQPLYQWHLTGVERAGRMRRPTRQPQPVWFKPFD
jgi:hypothetical protein